MAKRKVYVEAKRDNNLVMTTSLNLLLLTFFVALASLSTPNGQKTKMGLNSLMGGFGMLPGGKSAFQHEVGKDVTPEFSPLTKGSVDMNRLRATMAQGGVIEGTGVEKNRLGVTITMRSNVLFKENSDDFLPGAQKRLDLLATVLKDVPNNLTIAGHTDSRPVEVPPYGSNWGLSSARSMAVMSYLAGKGVTYGRMAAYGLGSQRPITSNDNEAGRRLNNRVELTILGTLPGDVKEKAQGWTEPIEQPLRAYRYKGFEFRLGEQ